MTRFMITDPSSWVREGRGRELQFFATDEEVLGWLTSAISSDYEPYSLIGFRMTPVGNTYEERIFETSIDDAPRVLLDAASSAHLFWIRSMVLTPELHIEANVRPSVVCSLNGLVLLDHGAMRHNRREASRLAVVDRVRNRTSEEARSHNEYVKVFESLRQKIEARLLYASLQQFRDGHTEEDVKVQRMTEAAARRHREGFLLAREPGRLIAQKPCD